MKSAFPIRNGRHPGSLYHDGCPGDRLPEVADDHTAHLVDKGRLRDIAIVKHQMQGIHAGTAGIDPPILQPAEHPGDVPAKAVGLLDGDPVEPEVVLAVAPDAHTVMHQIPVSL